ncbi:2-oxoacid ferredoxin oxidoreductase [Pseudomonas sp. GD03842]|uniref:2-oxoacid ferredoxin oxidoreductase n=1 Tax=unclassified Pseudomonas TaxID=196821 RepID=UPI000D38407D|nr:MULTISPECIES: 2-oxoacid ferredoxin oxidoreductase [unclassified Pseudomonas]MDH0747092.1 2-oxoacid ferredoxin oxidoreductase [Pseudomonas sp. GD03842]RAU44589.1 2-oxoacid ferredoxin oxidoreductase [Pseudomonas sp. RIT 409]RAU54975.1 2-oxoacid ferredoxin oxidoreductase [Pseudomonas sp. RIT 412]
MKHWAGAVALAMLAGCTSMSEVRSAGPAQVYSSEKPAAAVAECIKVSWANVQLFGDVADVFMENGKAGDFTVYTTESEYFADVSGKGGATTINFYAKPGAKVIEQRGAVVATCL